MGESPFLFLPIVTFYKKYLEVTKKSRTFANEIIRTIYTKKTIMTKVKLQSVAQTEKACLFSISFEGESFSEFEKFILKHQEAYSKDLNIILAYIQRMLNASGFLERYFRPEGKMRDRVCALPIESGKLRLYCLRLSNSVMIAGNGGVKNVNRYEDSQELNGYVITLQKLEEAIKIAVKKGNITIEEHSIDNYEDKFFNV